MFVLCPHCQFLVALLATGTAPGRCPRCDGILLAEDPAVPPSDDAAPAGAETAHAPVDDAAAGPGRGHAVTTADDTGHEPPMSAGIAAETTAIASGTTAEDEADGQVRVPDAAMAESMAAATPGSPAIDSGSAHAPAPQTPASSGQAHRPDHQQPAAEETTIAHAVLETTPPEPSHALSADTLADMHTADATADVLPAAQPVPAKKARNPNRTAIPSFARANPTAEPVDRRRFRLESAAIAALSLLLAMQWLLADRARLGADAGWRPLLSALCGVLGCDLPAWREPLAFTLVERDVRPHPWRAGALRVTATFRNDARWPQPWPGVLLTLSDIDGQVAGARVFTAHEYLGGAPTQNELGSGQTASIAMDVVEPTPRIVAFTFDFR